MEHRIGHRMPVRVQVTLSGRHSPEIKGQIMDFSARGAFIRLRGDYSGLHDIVHLRFPVCADHPEEYCECWALIVRRVSEGVGVMFDHLQESAMRKLQAPPRAAKNSATRKTGNEAARSHAHEFATH